MPMQTSAKATIPQMNHIFSVCVLPAATESVELAPNEKSRQSRRFICAAKSVLAAIAASAFRAGTGRFTTLHDDVDAEANEGEGEQDAPVSDSVHHSVDIEVARYGHSLQPLPRAHGQETGEHRHRGDYIERKICKTMKHSGLIYRFSLQVSQKLPKMQKTDSYPTSHTITWPSNIS